MTLTRELRTTIAFVLAMVFALTAFVVGNQRLVQADEPLSMAEQINCYIEQGAVGSFQVGHDYCQGVPPGESEDPSLAEQIICHVDWLLHEEDPEIPFEPDLDYCEMLAQDMCSNIPGVQVTVPEGKVLQGGICVDAPNGGGDTGADLAVSKTVSDNSPTPSSTIVYTITVTSTGPASSNNVTITDLLPAGVSHVSDSGSGAYATTTGVWTIGTMASGTVATLTITAMVVAGTGVEVTNTASVSGSSATDSNTGNNTSSVSFTVTEDGQGGGGSNDDDGDSSGGGSSGGGSRRSSGGSNNNGEVLGAQTECPMYLTGYIKYGAQNDAGEVAKLQVFLNAFEGNALPVTGTYGPQTLAAVNAFQAKYAADVLTPWGLQGATGYVYYTTQKQINTIYCKFQKDFPLSVSQIEEIAYVREIQPTLRAQGITSMGAAAGAVAGAATARPTSPAVGSVVLPVTATAQDENKTAASSTNNASSTPGWFSRFVDWLFGR